MGNENLSGGETIESPQTKGVFESLPVGTHKNVLFITSLNKHIDKMGLIVSFSFVLCC